MGQEPAHKNRCLLPVDGEVHHSVPGVAQPPVEEILIAGEKGRATEAPQEW